MKSGKENHLLSTVGGKVKDKDGEEGYAHARNYQVHLKSQIRLYLQGKFWYEMCVHLDQTV